MGDSSIQGTRGRQATTKLNAAERVKARERTEDVTADGFKGKGRFASGGGEG